MNRMFAFHGVDSKVGTTMVSQSVAEMIADSCRDIKIMLVSLNGKSGTEYVSRVGESIEGIKMYLDNKLLSKKDLLKSCKRSDNLFQLGGVESIGQARHFSPEAASFFLDSVEDDFDVIIADTGNDLDNGLAVGALEKIFNRVLILTQQESMLRRYEKLQPLYIQLGISFPYIIVNKYTEKDPYTMNYISERLNIPSEKLKKAEAVSFDRQAEMDCRTLISYNNEKYNADIAKLANIILQNCGYDPIQIQRKKRWKAFI